jgi:hypothetical protein
MSPPKVGGRQMASEAAELSAVPVAITAVAMRGTISPAPRGVCDRVRLVARRKCELFCAGACGGF